MWAQCIKSVLAVSETPHLDVAQPFTARTGVPEPSGHVAWGRRQREVEPRHLQPLPNFTLYPGK